jgi:hypothetical protein
MSSIEEVLAKDLGWIATADELVRRFGQDHDRLREAAALWIEQAAASGVPEPLDSSSNERLKSAYLLVEQATVGSQPLHEWARRARRTRFYWGSGRWGVIYDASLLNIVVWLWPHRAASERERLDQLARWGASVAQPCSRHLAQGTPCDGGGLPALLGALALSDFPDLAYAVVAPVEADPRLSASGFSAAVALRRLSLPGPLDARDEQALRGFGVQNALTNRTTLHTFLEFAGESRHEMAWLWSEVRAALEVPVAWGGAIAGLCASPRHQEQAISLLAAAMRDGVDPVEPLRRACHALPPLGKDLFDGPGWGRDKFAKKLRPLTRALVDRGVWPIDVLKKCLPRRPPEPTKPTTTANASEPIEPWTERKQDGVEQKFERMRAMLAEAMLQIGLDDTEQTERRLKALDSLERLSPEDQSFRQALSKLQHADELVARRARAVQRELDRAKHADAELAVLDACEILGLAIVRGSR